MCLRYYIPAHNRQWRARWKLAGESLEPFDELNFLPGTMKENAAFSWWNLIPVAPFSPCSLSSDSLLPSDLQQQHFKNYITLHFIF